MSNRSNTFFAQREFRRLPVKNEQCSLGEAIIGALTIMYEGFPLTQNHGICRDYNEEEGTKAGGRAER